MVKMKKDRIWFLTAILTKKTPILLKNLTVQDLKDDGFDSWNEGVWGLLEINGLLRKNMNDNYLNWVLNQYCVIYEWNPLFNEPQKPEEKLRTILCTKFIDKIERGDKKRTIRFNLKYIVPGDRFWLVHKKEPEAISTKKQTDLRTFLGGK